MPLYDLMLLLDPGVPSDRQESILSDVKTQLESGGTLVGSQDWGQRRMTFEIDHRPDAAYHLFQFEAESGGALLERVDHALKITDGVLRHRIVRLKDGSPPPPMPSPERGGYGGYNDVPPAPPVDPAAAEAAPGATDAPTEPAAPAPDAAVPDAPAETAPAGDAPAPDAAVADAPAETAPAGDAPAPDAAVADTPAETAPAEAAPAADAPAAEDPAAAPTDGGDDDAPSEPPAA
jgi:small subunit ribosomal protein S6